MNENKGRKAWTTAAHECVRKYNETVHTVTKFSPKYLLEGTNTSILPNELSQRKT